MEFLHDERADERAWWGGKSAERIGDFLEQLEYTLLCTEIQLKRVGVLIRTPEGKLHLK